VTEQHPITPPPELVKQWFDGAFNDGAGWPRKVAVAAARWGADQELEACCEWLIAWDTCEGEKIASLLREGRRPKPPSLKEQALADFDWLVGRTLGRPEADERSERIRRALEQLND
jgi:hypothetical protein